MRSAIYDLRLYHRPKTIDLFRKSQIAPRKSGDSAHRWRVSRNGGFASGIIGGSAAGGGGMVRRDRKKRLWAAGWGVPLPEPFPSPPISPCSLRQASPFRCERSERAESPACSGRPLAAANAVEQSQCGGSIICVWLRFQSHKAITHDYPYGAGVPFNLPPCPKIKGDILIFQRIIVD